MVLIDRSLLLFLRSIWYGARELFEWYDNKFGNLQRFHARPLIFIVRRWSDDGDDYVTSHLLCGDKSGVRFTFIRRHKYLQMT